MKNLRARDYAKILYELTKDLEPSQFDRIMDEFVKFLVENNSVSKLKEIISEFESYSKEAEGIKELEVTTAVETDAETLSRLKSIFGENTQIKTKINKDILGGMVILDKNTLYDASVRYQLNRLKNYLE